MSASRHLVRCRLSVACSRLSRALGLASAVGGLAWATTASAQQPAPPTPAPLRLTLDDAVSRAIAASPRLARLASLEAAASAQERGSRAERLPQLELTAGYVRRSEIPELTIAAPASDPTQPPRPITVFPNIPDNYRLRAGAQLPLYTGGRIGGQIAAAEQGRTAARHDLAAARADLVLETKAAYWSLVTASDALDLLQEAIRAYDAHLADARNRERFGLAARNEVLAVQVERDRVELDRLRAEAGAGIAAANLRRLLDLPPDQDLEPSEPLLDLPPEAAAAPEVEGLVAEALGSRPERAALAARAAAAFALVRLERGGRLPQLALAAGVSYANPNRDLVPPTADWKQSWDLGASLTWNALDFGRRSAAQARAAAHAQAAREQLRELERAIRLEVTQRLLELRTARARVPVAERGVSSALENRRVAGDRYRAGVIPSSELLDAEVAHERATLALTEALAALRLAEAGLERALGR